MDAEEGNDVTPSEGAAPEGQSQPGPAASEHHEQTALLSAPGPVLPRSPAAAESLGPEVYKTLLSSILSLRIAPDSRITVDALARELGVSPTPIREALVRLEAEGLVVKTHLRGYRAAPALSREDFESLFDIRMVLEPHGARRAAERRLDEHVVELRRINEQMRARREVSDTLSTYAESAALDAQFHDTVALASGNRLIRESLSRLHAHLHLFRAKQHSSVGLEAIREHDWIADAIADRDQHMAEAAARSHLERSLQRMRHAID